jgi:hypothetical protein
MMKLRATSPYTTTVGGVATWVTVTSAVGTCGHASLDNRDRRTTLLVRSVVKSIVHNMYVPVPREQSKVISDP